MYNWKKNYKKSKKNKIKYEHIKGAWMLSIQPKDLSINLLSLFLNP